MASLKVWDGEPVITELESAGSWGRGGLGGGGGGSVCVVSGGDVVVTVRWCGWSEYWWKRRVCVSVCLGVKGVIVRRRGGGGDKRPLVNVMQ